jgi:pimeloyl-ACP methyl ester carboxylesterase
MAGEAILSVGMNSKKKYSTSLLKPSYIFPLSLVLTHRHQQKKPLDVDDYATWVKSYIAKNKLGKPVVIGHSNGGRILIKVASHNPKLISKLILINSAGIPEKNSAKKAIFKSIAKTGKAFLAVLKNTPIEKISKKILYKLAGESDYNNASPTMKKTMINMLTYNPVSDLKKMKAETLCIWGAQDKSTPLWMGEKIHNYVKKSHLEVILNGGHNIHRTHPLQVAQLIVNFIKE